MSGRDWTPYRCASVRPTLRGAAAIVALWICPGLLFAQDDEVVPEAPNVAAEAQFMVADENFDQWVFGGRGNAAANQKRLETLLKVQIEGVAGTCQLTDLQKKKLSLAGSVDIKRFFSRVAQLKKRFDQIKNDQNRFQEFWQHVQPVQTEMNRGLFQEGSYFRKTLKTLLTPEQVAECEAADRARRLFSYRSKVETVVNSLDEVMSLRAAQRRKLVELLTAPERVPRTMGQENIGLYAVLYQAARIPQQQLAEFLDPPQVNTLQQITNMTRGYAQFLKTNGYTWDGDPDPEQGRGAADDVLPAVGLVAAALIKDAP